MRIGFFFLLWYVFLPALCLWGARFKRHGFFRDNLDMDQCNAVKGISIFLVLTGHMLLGYVAKCEQWDPSLRWNQLFRFLDSFFINQLMVVMFMFYTGFGLMESLKKKGEGYMISFPRNRILKVLLNLDVAILVYLVLSIVMGADVSINKVLLSLVGWESLGNSNWYICVILMCYALFWLAFHPKKPWRHREASLAAFTIYLIILWIFLSYARAGKSWWWNKLMVVPFGILVSMYREKLRTFIDRHYLSTTCCATALFLSNYAFFYALRCRGLRWPDPNGGIAFNLRSILFAMVVVLVTRKVKIANPVLAWLGANLFPLYIYHRIPMWVLKVVLGDEFVYNHVPLYCVMSIGLAVAIAWLYRFFEIRHIPQWRRMSGT